MGTPTWNISAQITQPHQLTFLFPETHSLIQFLSQLVYSEWEIRVIFANILQHNLARKKWNIALLLILFYYYLSHFARHLRAKDKKERKFFSNCFQYLP